MCIIQYTYLYKCVCAHVQHRTLEAALDRGEKLDDLVGKSEELSLHSKAFYTTVSRVTSLSLHSSESRWVSLSISESRWVSLSISESRWVSLSISLSCVVLFCSPVLENHLSYDVSTNNN